MEKEIIEILKELKIKHENNALAAKSSSEYITYKYFIKDIGEVIKEIKMLIKKEK